MMATGEERRMVEKRKKNNNINIAVLGGVFRVGVVGGRRKSKQSRSSTIM